MPCRSRSLVTPRSTPCTSRSSNHPNSGARVHRAAILGGMGYEAIDASGGAQLKVMAPLAPAFELSIPERPADTGLFGPESIVWRVHHDRSFPLAGERGLMVLCPHDPQCAP